MGLYTNVYVPYVYMQCVLLQTKERMSSALTSPTTGLPPRPWKDSHQLSFEAYQQQRCLARKGSVETPENAVCTAQQAADLRALDRWGEIDTAGFLSRALRRHPAGDGPVAQAVVKAMYRGNIHSLHGINGREANRVRVLDHARERPFEQSEPYLVGLMVQRWSGDAAHRPAIYDVGAQDLIAAATAKDTDPATQELGSAALSAASRRGQTWVMETRLYVLPE